jgi:hypothetical protein
MPGLSGILVALFLLISLAYRGGSVLFLAPAGARTALVATAVSREPLLGHSGTVLPTHPTAASERRPDISAAIKHRMKRTSESGR